MDILISYINTINNWDVADKTEKLYMVIPKRYIEDLKKHLKGVYSLEVDGRSIPMNSYLIIISKNKIQIDFT